MDLKPAGEPLPPDDHAREAADEAMGFVGGRGGKSFSSGSVVNALSLRCVVNSEL